MRDLELDEALRIVGFGAFQVQKFFLLFFVGIFHGARMTSSIYFLLGAKHRCRVPGLTNDTYDTSSYSYEEQVLYNRSIPPSDSCHIYSLHHNFTYDEYNQPENGSQFLQGCQYQHWVYQDDIVTNNAVMQFHFVCDDSELKTHATMLLYMGALFGGTFMGIVSDRFGRLKCLLLCVFIFLPCGIGLAWVKHFATFYVLQFIMGAVSTGMFTAALVIGLELVEPSKRKVPGLFIMLFFTVGEFLLTASFYGLKDWLWVSLVITAPTAFFFTYYWLVPESPRWLMLHKKYDQVAAVLQSMAVKNGVELPGRQQNEDLERLLQSQEVDGAGENRARKKDTFLDLFRSCVLACRTLAICFNWIVVNLIFYGFILNAVYLKAGNEYVNSSIGAAVEVPAHLTTLALVDKVGRKPVHIGMLVLAVLASAAAMGAALGCDSEHLYVVAILAMIGKYAAAGLMGTSFLWMTELFPTSVRATGLGVGSSFARIGALISPYIVHASLTISDPKVGHAMPFIVFGLASLLALLFNLILPETHGRPVLETVEQARNFGREPENQALLNERDQDRVQVYHSFDE
ncbi:organic cation transporter protein [Plakobranchus ocellatus]|uniref:Organic cation transporter protein n=1 Tax=Plakobranchus ocellatus TaxID=259542 RepID=A0AAV3ZG37_9GAST|nr:organic cation transporter protein [Plakobranchus ocellatus]